jgi:hypothetical protein
MAKRSQTGDVLAHLIEHGSITTYEAYQKYGCTRLPSRIYDYRQKGYEIESDSLTTKNRYGNTVTVAVYRLKAMPDAAV